MFFSRLSVALLVLAITALLSVNSADAARGPQITNIVYFDITHGDESLGRSALVVSSAVYSIDHPP